MATKTADTTKTTTDTTKKTDADTATNDRRRSSYFCSACDFPSDVFGLLNPCQHVYCQPCASQMSDCVICTERVDSVRVVRDMGTLYVSPLTLQGGVGAEGRRWIRAGLDNVSVATGGEHKPVSHP